MSDELCPMCSGDGHEYVENTYPSYHRQRLDVPCPVCRGEGFLDCGTYEAFWAYVQRTGRWPGRFWLRESVSAAA